MPSVRLQARLEQREAVLRLLDRKRAATGKPDLGSALEAKILALEMADLEAATAAQAAAKDAIKAKVRATRNDA
jgi:hypothetical protein